MDFLSLCVFLHPDAIPEEIFTENTSYKNELIASKVKDYLASSPIVLSGSLSVSDPNSASSSSSVYIFRQNVR